MTETKLSGMVINKIDSEDTYQKLVEAGQIGKNDISFVESEDTSVSLGLTGAAVGDIIRVKSVDADGKPTEWEAADSIKLLKKVGEYTLSENATLFEVNNLNINADAISLRFKKGGTNCNAGISVWLNGIRSSSYAGTFGTTADAYQVLVWLWKQDNQWYWYNIQANGATNNAAYSAGFISSPITSIGLSTPYMDNNTAEDVTEGNYIASGATMQIFEGVFPNVK